MANSVTNIVDNPIESVKINNILNSNRNISKATWN